MRQIKFRVWSTIQNKYKFPVLDVTNDFNTRKELGYVFQQYTGLKDIYEGDILPVYFSKLSSRTVTKKVNGVVVFHYGAFRLKFNHPENGEVYGNLDDFIDREIIGNIHENPELLK